MPRQIDDASFGKGGLHQQLAVGTAVLAEVNQQPLALCACLAHVFAEVEKRLDKPGRKLDRVR